VTYYLSDGSLTARMPAVVGMEGDDAAIEVGKATSGSISYAYVKTEDPAQLCRVASSDPAAGQAMAPTAPVTLTVYSDKDGSAPPPGSCT
jgi:beta-lactam-binding protein with PASTA domain